MINIDAFLQHKNGVQKESASNNNYLLDQENVDSAALFEETSVLPSNKAPILMLFSNANSSIKFNNGQDNKWWK